MKKLFYVLTFVFASPNLFCQDEKQEMKEPIIKLSGHIRYDAYFDTHESVAARDGDVYLYPTRQILNGDNEDIKGYNSLNMFAYETRLRAKISGPDAMGAKISGLVEIDFEGRANGHENSPRARHLFMNMDWGQTKLLIGQYWHPTFVTECFPEVIVAGAGAPFQPFNRSTQVALTHKLTDELEVSGAVLSHFDMESMAGSAAQNNAVLPDIHGNIKYKSGNLVTGIIAGYRLLKPRNYTAANAITTEKNGSFDVAAFGKLTANDFTFKLYGIYGQEMTPFVMIGGMGAAEDPTLVDDYSYGNINTYAVWSEIIYKLGAIDYGLFVGYTSNIGSSTDDFFMSTSFTRGADIDNIVRVSPRVTYTTGRVSFALEYMLTAATYMTLLGNKYEATQTDDAVINNRIAFAAQYTF